MEIFVGNLPFDITEQEIRDKFAECGAVSNVKMLMDKFSGRFRGIAFVSMDDEQQAQAAIETLDGAELGGRPMKVDRSRERTERFNGFGGGFRPRNSGRFDNRHREDSDTRQSGEFRRDGGNFRQNSDGEYRPRGGFRPRGNFRSGDGYRPREGGFKPRGEGFRPRSDDGFGGDGEYRPRKFGNDGYRPKGDFNRGGKFGDKSYRPKSGFRPRDNFRQRDDDEGGRFRSRDFSEE